ncbi:MAG: CotH kinase family protein [Oscillospiraceae bacterium]|nr:CotH kinase family protein [Oscillospiraceae bacterium]
MLYTKSRLFISKLKIVLVIAVIVLFVSLILIYSGLSLNPDSGDKGALDSIKTFNIKMPESAVLKVSDIRIKGFTLSWKNLDGDCEYAIAASSWGKIDDYKTALENNYIILDFTPGDILNGSYKATKMIAGKDYEIKLFARKKNTQAAEYLSAKASLPYLDEAELVKVYLDGEEMLYNSSEDSFTKVYIPGNNKNGEYNITYKLARLCALYINGVKIEDESFIIKEGENILVTAINEKTNAARDYEIAVMPLDNGLPVISINIENNRHVTSKNKYLEAEMTITESMLNSSEDYIDGLFSGEIEIKLRGHSSSGMPKKSYNIKISEKSGILDMAPAKKWAFVANYSDKSLMRNYIAYELYRDMGAFFSPKFRFVDLIVNGEYMGNYIIGEKVKIGKGRLDLPKIKTEETVKIKRKGTLTIPPTSGKDLNGSYVLEVNSTDKYDKGEIIFETKRINWRTEHFFSIKQPSEKNMSVEAYDYISNYVNETEDAIFAENFKDPKNGYRKYIDASTFIDWYIVNELFKNVDAGFHTSVYMYKPRDGKLCMGPVWDFDIGAGNIDYAGCDDPKGWYVRYSAWFSRLFEDEAFAKEFKDRWNEVKANYFGRIFTRIDETAMLLEKSQAMNFDRWKILGVYVWPNADGVESRRTYESEVEYLKDWLNARIDWIDKEINK